MERYSLEKAQNEASQIRQKAIEIKAQKTDLKEDSIEPSPDDYRNAEQSLEEMRITSEVKDSEKIEELRKKMEAKYGYEARLKQIREQVNLIRSWSESQNLREGEDYIIQEDLKKYAESEGVEIAPHDIKRFALGISRTKVGKFRDFFEQEYRQQMKAIDPKGEVQLDYSWGGRFCVGFAGVPCDTVIISDMKTLKIETHHATFKKFFRERTGFDFPSGETLNLVLRRISKEGLPLYEKIQAEISKRDANQTLPDVIYSGVKDHISHCVEILRRASSEDRDAVKELSENYLPSAEINTYNDLTYNIDDLPDLDLLKDTIGIEIPDEFRMDKIFQQPEIVGNSVYFKKERMEELCKEFSDYLIQGNKN